MIKTGATTYIRIWLYFFKLQSIALIPDWLRLRIWVRYIRNPVYPNNRTAVQNILEDFPGDWNVQSGTVCANSGITESGIRAIDCMCLFCFKTNVPNHVFELSCYAIRVFAFTKHSSSCLAFMKPPNAVLQSKVLATLHYFVYLYLSDSGQFLHLLQSVFYRNATDSFTRCAFWSLCCFFNVFSYTKQNLATFSACHNWCFFATWNFFLSFVILNIYYKCAQWKSTPWLEKDELFLREPPPKKVQISLYSWYK